MVIPRLIHFIWIQGDGPKRFGQGEFLSVVSALRNTTHQVMLHTNLEADVTNPYCPYRISHARLAIQRQEMPLVIHGVKARMANLSDIWRIRVLKQYGGIYSDLDIIWFEEPDSLWGPTDPVFVSAYENPSYKTAANAFLAAVPGYEPFGELLGDFDIAFQRLAARGITDLTVDPSGGLSRYHCLLWKTTGDFSKQRASLILGKHPFYKNGWRRIGRCLRRAGVALNPAVDLDALGGTDDRLQLDRITGFHYYAALYDIEQLMDLPDFREKITPVLDFAAPFLTA